MGAGGGLVSPRGLPGSREWLEDVLAKAREGAAKTPPTSEVGAFFRQEIADLEQRLASIGEGR